jgi:hypothetical protein
MTEEDRGPDRSIGARFYSASRYHARKARALADTSSPHERLDAVTHAGAAVELIAKAVLADLDVRLLPDREALHTLLETIAELRGRRDTLATRSRLALRSPAGQAGRRSTLASDTSGWRATDRLHRRSAPRPEPVPYSIVYGPFGVVVRHVEARASDSRVRHRAHARHGVPDRPRPRLARSTLRSVCRREFGRLGIVTS